MNEWDSVAEKWNSSMQNGDWFQKFIIYPTVKNFLGDAAGKKIIDIGCGNGHLSRYLSSLGAEVTGIDKSKQMIAMCRRYKSKAAFRVCDITEAKVPAEKYQVAIFNNSLQDMQNFVAAIRSAHSLLCEGGELIIAVKHPCFHPDKSELGWLIECADGSSFFTGPGLTELASCGKEYRGKYFAMDGYFSGASHVRSWFGENTVSFARTLQDYLNGIIQSGFSLREIREPVPLKDGENQNPHLYALLTRIPNFIFLKATKEK